MKRLRKLALILGALGLLLGVWAFGAEPAYLRVREVPIDFLERERGESKMSAGIATESLRRITRWGVERRRAGLQARLGAGRGERARSR